MHGYGTGWLAFQCLLVSDPEPSVAGRLPSLPLTFLPLFLSNKAEKDHTQNNKILKKSVDALSMGKVLINN